MYLPSEKLQLIDEYQVKKQQYEDTVLRNFERIYPLSDYEKSFYKEDFEVFLDHASRIFRKFTGTSNVINVDSIKKMV